MTRFELNEIYNNWHDRSIRLRDIKNDNGEPIARRIQANRLGEIMVDRVMQIHFMLIKANTPKSLNFQKGGIIT